VGAGVLVRVGGTHWVGVGSVVCVGSVASGVVSIEGDSVSAAVGTAVGSAPRGA
jgi:hypothetical protein